MNFFTARPCIGLVIYESPKEGGLAEISINNMQSTAEWSLCLRFRCISKDEGRGKIISLLLDFFSS